MGYEYTDGDGDEIAVTEGMTGAIVGITNEREYNNILVKKEQAPALALAVLEAAGYEHTLDENQTQIGNIVGGLRRVVKEQAAAAQEAADREALEREAEELYRASYAGTVYNDYWRTSPKGTRELWFGVARAARKLHQKEEGK